MNEKQLRYTGLVISIILAFTTIVNMSVTTYVLWNDRQTASMSPNSEEYINIAMEADLGRPSPLTYLLRRMQNWWSSYTVGGSAVETATVDLTIQVTGSNVASTASVDYYIEAKETGGSGTPYRFLAGNGSAVSVGGASLIVDDDRAITSHLTQMGLSTSESWTIDYYVYVIATVTGAISGETLTSEISYTKFDTVTYTFDDPGTWTSAEWIRSNGYAGYVTHEASAYSDAASSTGTIRMGARTASYSFGAYVCFDMDDQPSPPPQGAIIQEAYVQLSASDSWTAREVTISAYDGVSWSSTYIDNYGEWTTRMGMQTTASESWTIPSAVQYNHMNSSDITSIIQELVDIPTFSSSSRVTIFWDSTEDTGADEAKFYCWLTNYKPTLYIRWSSYSASWYDIPPLSVVDMPITLEVGAVLVTGAVAVYILQEERRRRNE